MAGRSEAEGDATGGGLGRALGVWRAASWGERLELARAAARAPARLDDERARQPVASSVAS